MIFFLEFSEIRSVSRFWFPSKRSRGPIEAGSAAHRLCLGRGSSQLSHSKQTTRHSGFSRSVSPVCLKNGAQTQTPTASIAITEPGSHPPHPCCTPSRRLCRACAAPPARAARPQAHRAAPVPHRPSVPHALKPTVPHPCRTASEDGCPYAGKRSLRRHGLLWSLGQQAGA